MPWYLVLVYAAARQRSVSLSRVDVGSRIQAQTSDWQKLYGLLVDASAWLREKGLRQWNPEYPSHRFVREVDAGNVWYWAVDGEPIATVTLYERRPGTTPRISGETRSERGMCVGSP